MAAPPLVTGDDVAAALGGRPDATVCDLAAAAADAAVRVEIDAPPDDADATYQWPPGAVQAALLVAVDLFRVQSAQGAGYALDDTTWTAERYTTRAVQRYEALYASARAVGGMAG